MMRVTLILNPRSGKGRAMSVRDDARRIARELDVELTERVIEAPAHGTQFAREAIASGQQRVISVGGDGTLNAIAAGLVGSGVPLGIVAMGSGNGYARSQQLPLSPGPALYRAFTGTVKAMDVGYLNERLFLGIAGIGFDARVAWEFDRSAARGFWNYVRITLKEILDAKPMRVVLKANNENAELHVLMLVFANTREFGNGIAISPGSAPDDGMAELRCVSKPSLFRLVKAFYDVYAGHADRSPHVRTIATREATVTQTGLHAHLDGEPVVIGHEVSFRLEPKRLLVVV
jgi:diacylglycerol kinase (ATP)